jgi:hypothetical protein
VTRSGESTPFILIDAPEDGCIEECGWVEATVSAERACELIVPLCDEFRPDLAGVTRVTLVPLKDPAKGDDEAQRWLPPDQVRSIAQEQSDDASELDEAEVESLDDRLAEAKEFWQVPVVDPDDA